MNFEMKRLFHHAVIPGTGWPGDMASASTPIAPYSDSVENLAKTSTNLRELSARVSVCKACPRLVEWREEVAETKKKSFSDQTYWGRPAPGFGDEHGWLAVVGLAPAAHGANRTGRVFTGDRTGDFLVASMFRQGLANQPTSVSAGDGLKLTGVRILSAVRCAPPKNAPTSWEQNMCSSWLDRELELINPRVILALGGIGWRATCLALGRAGWQVPKPRPKFGHGAEFSMMHEGKEITVVGSYHPSQHNTFTGVLTEQMMDDVFKQCQICVNGEDGY